MTKVFRQGQILQLVERREIHTQDDLVDALAALGISASQVTLSRDIHELGLVKTAQGYRQVGPLREGPSLATVVQEFLREVRIAKNLLILKTLSGNANAVAVALDREQWSEVVGTVAGDDTVLIVAADDAVAAALQARLLSLVKD